MESGKTHDDERRLDVLDTPRGCALRPVRSHRRTARGDCRPDRDAPLGGVRDRVADQELVYEAGVVASELLSNAARACRSRIALRLEVHHGSSASRSTTTVRVSRLSARRAQTRSAAADCGSSTRSRRRGARSRDRPANASGPRCRSSARLRRTWTAPTAVADSAGGERPRVPRPPPRASDVIMRSAAIGSTGSGAGSRSRRS